MVRLKLRRERLSRSNPSGQLGRRDSEKRKQLSQRPGETQPQDEFREWTVGLCSWSSDGRMEEGLKSGIPERHFIDPGLFCKTQRQYSFAPLPHEACIWGRWQEQHGGGEPGGGQGCFRKSVQPSRADRKMVFAKAEMVAMQRGLLKGHILQAGGIGTTP